MVADGGGDAAAGRQQEQQAPTMLWTVGLVGVLVIAIGGLLHRRKAAKERAKAAWLAPAEQVERDADVARAEGKIFSGIRVVDLSTHVAAPGASRCLADLGAEVIKVEVPSGDLLRNTLLAFEKPRTHSTLYESQNLSKWGAQLDLKTAEGVKELRKLLAGADVLITSTRGQSLTRLGLEPAAVRKDFPHLVYAQVSAWGLNGEDKDLPGYDVGAFWTATGIAAITNEKGGFSRYPGAFGDQTTAQFLLNAVQLALLDRLRTGRGRHVSTCLLHAGSWVMAPLVLGCTPVEDGKPPDYDDRPPKPVVDNVYVTKDDLAVAFTFSGSYADEAVAAGQLCSALGLPADASNASVAAKLGEMRREDVVKAVKDCSMIRLTNFEGMVETLDRVGAAFRADDYKPESGVVDPTPPGLEDLPFSPRIPFELSAFAGKHGPTTPAPNKGEHTEDILRRGWLSKPLEWTAPQEVSAGPPSERPLAHLTVIEIADVQTQHNCAVPAASKLLLDMGARVYRMLPGEDPLAETDPTAFRHFNDGKQSATPSEALEMLRTGGASVVLVTDMQGTQLSVGGEVFDLEAIVAAGTIVAQLDGPSSAFADAFMRSGLAAIMGGNPPAHVSRFPRYAFESIMSVFMLSGITAALFHQERTKQAQRVTLSLERVGMWMAQINSNFVLRDYGNEPMTTPSTKSKVRNSPLPTYSCHVTKDGLWVQLLGLDTARHLPRILNAFGIKGRVAAGAIYNGLFKVLPRRHEKNLLLKLEPLFVGINDAIAARFAQFTYAELVVLFRKHDIWFSPIRVPSQLLSYQQTWDNEIFKRTPEGIKATAPILMH